VEGLGDEQLTFRLSMEASRRGVYFLGNIYPVLRLVEKSNPHRALIHAMAKQESGFSKQAESPKMAKGLMQIIPSTAKAICRELKIKYSSYSLKSDVGYSLKIANHYLNQLSRQFRGSQILMIAAYNAGPEAVNRWMGDSGDPRGRGTEETIDWIESLGCRETRVYLQRVLEAIPIYERIFSGEK
jgi:soluble lytic murein transglycosylase